VRTLSARLLLALTAAALAGLVAAAPAGAHHTLDGALQGVHADYFDAGSSVTQWQLDTGGRKLDVLPTRLPALTPEHDSVALDDKDPSASVAGPVTASSPQAAPALGPRKTAVIAFNFASNPTNQPWTTAAIRSSIFTAADSTSAFFKEESYNQLWLTGRTGNLDGDVYGWYTLPVAPTGCPDPQLGHPEWTSAYLQWASLAKTRAQLDGFDANAYQHVMYVFPSGTDCQWAGLAYMPGKESWINNDLSVRVTGHELSHNLGIHHAGSWFCIGASGQAVPISSSCTLNEYNDPFDVMGYWGSRHSNGWHLQQLGLLQASNVQTVTQSGTYSLTSALDPTTEPTTLRIPRTYGAGGAVQDWYYVEIRESGGVFESFPGSLSSALTGVSIRAVDDPSRLTQSRLLDTDAGGGIADAPLETGRTFSDGKISVTTLSAGGGAATVAIDMNAPPLDQQSPSAPTGLSHVLLAAGLRLSWDGSGDNVGVSSYPVYRDGMEVGSAASNSYDDTTVLPGQHVYTVYAQDAAGNRSPASDPYVVTVPARRAVSLKQGSTDRTGPRLRLIRRRLSRDRVRLTAKARDKGGVARMELRIDGRRVRARRASRLSYRWHRRPGRHRIVVVAYDKRGNRSTYRLSLRVRA
jgi:Gametolysin peptidase M11